MSQAPLFQPARRATRLASGLLGLAMGAGVIVSVVQGMGAQSGGQSLGHFVASQRAVVNQPMAQVTVPAALQAPAEVAARDAV